ncbi:MAG: glycosyltransferase family 2 protein [Anaerolineae bacterium]|nr:glycosyltransferase family 2 protein [Anaerolineae bacterium]
MLIDNWPVVTVIMPVLNEAAFIHRSLGAVLAQDYPRDRLEILVVDGGSGDGTGQIVQDLLKTWPRSRLLDNPRRIQSAALNIGIQAAAGEIIIRVDGHTLIEPDYVKTCVRLLTNGEFENVGGLMRPVGQGYVGRGVAMATTSFFGIAGSKFHYSAREQVVDTVYMGAFRRTIFDRVGLFDEQLKINEDYEFNYRLRQAGGKILLSPALKSTYVPRHSLGALWRQYFRYGRWKVRMLQKHPESLRWRQAVPPVFVGTLAGSLLAGLLWRPARWLFVCLTGSYLLANGVASTIAARRGGWRYLPILPMIFATIHLAWGSGFWYSLLTIALQGGKLKR